MNGILDRMLWLAMGTGFLGAIAALYGRYRTLPPWLTGPTICRLEAGGCQVLFRTKNAALLGVPNSLLAVFYYPALAAGILLHWPWILLFSGASSAFLMTLILAWILMRDRLECRVCWTGHACNAVIWAILFLQHAWK
ncbi:MAG TPA: vitamin K epoxide reductase family protein [bacterium]|nr:vitamin K epoxide reductase family protein [bacterium]